MRQFFESCSGVKIVRQQRFVSAAYRDSLTSPEEIRGPRFWPDESSKTKLNRGLLPFQTTSNNLIESIINSLFMETESDKNERFVLLSPMQISFVSLEK